MDSMDVINVVVMDWVEQHFVQMDLVQLEILFLNVEHVKLVIHSTQTQIHVIQVIEFYIFEKFDAMWLIS